METSAVEITSEYRGKQVNWTIPGTFYTALRELHDWAEANFPPGVVPHSEETFCLGLLLAGYEKSEENRRKYEEAKQIVVTPKKQILIPGGPSLIAR